MKGDVGALSRIDLADDRARSAQVELALAIKERDEKKAKRRKRSSPDDSSEATASIKTAKRVLTTAWCLWPDAVRPTERVARYHSRIARARDEHNKRKYYAEMLSDVGIVCAPRIEGAKYDDIADIVDKKRAHRSTISPPVPILTTAEPVGEILFAAEDATTTVYARLLRPDGKSAVYVLCGKGDDDEVEARDVHLDRELHRQLVNAAIRVLGLYET
jgi:hypothetical protein